MVIFHGYVSLRVDDIHEGSIYVFLWFFTSYYLLTGTTCISIVDRFICNLFIDIYIYKYICLWRSKCQLIEIVIYICIYSTLCVYIYIMCIYIYYVYIYIYILCVYIYIHCICICICICIYVYVYVYVYIYTWTYIKNSGGIISLVALIRLNVFWRRHCQNDKMKSGKNDTQVTNRYDLPRREL